MFSELKKKIWRRTEFWITWITIGLLIDEYIKEGYLFKIEDVFNANITHEKIIVLLIVLLITIMVRKKRKESNP
ncbi:MAG: hypothetical protein DRO40_08610 [Thermoprotei archaeon]|nr:MAG: hypothetical protein DRO40_08610 [Thermoprotei archaeon]